MTGAGGGGVTAGTDTGVGDGTNGLAAGGVWKAGGAADTGGQGVRGVGRSGGRAAGRGGVSWVGRAGEWRGVATGVMGRLAGPAAACSCAG